MFLNWKSMCVVMNEVICPNWSCALTGVIFTQGFATSGLLTNFVEFDVMLDEIHSRNCTSSSFCWDNENASCGTMIPSANHVDQI